MDKAQKAASKMEQKQQKDMEKAKEKAEQNLEWRNKAVEAALKDQKQKAEDLATQPSQDFAASQKSHEKALHKATKEVAYQTSQVEKMKHGLATKPDKTYKQTKNAETQRLENLKIDLQAAKDLQRSPDEDEEEFAKMKQERATSLKAEVEAAKERVKTAPEAARKETEDLYSERLANSEQAAQAALQDQILKQQNV